MTVTCASFLLIVIRGRRNKPPTDSWRYSFLKSANIWLQPRIKSDLFSILINSFIVLLALTCRSITQCQDPHMICQGSGMAVIFSASASRWASASCSLVPKRHMTATPPEAMPINIPCPSASKTRKLSTLPNSARAPS